MVQKKTLIGVASFFIVFTILIGYYALAAEAGGRDNPLVTVGYLDGIDIDGKVQSALDTYFAGKMEEIDQKIADAYLRISEMGEGGGGGINLAEDEAFIASVAELVAAKVGSSSGGGGVGGIYEKITLPAGATMKMTMGSSFFLRVGSAVCVSTGDPGLVDTTTPGTIGNGAAIESNHVYFVTVDGGRGIKNSGTGDVIIFFMGSYTIE